jgi:spore germination cell wall hydrolase CwlJ-like protein
MTNSKTLWVRGMAWLRTAMEVAVYLILPLSLPFFPQSNWTAKANVFDVEIIDQKRWDEGKGKFAYVHSHALQEWRPTRESNLLAYRPYASHEVKCTAAMIKEEAAKEPREGQLLAAYVAGVRSLRQKKDLCKVVCSGEFDGPEEVFCPAYRKAGTIPQVTREYLLMAHHVLAGHYKPPEKCRDAEYFYHPKISSRGGVEWFAYNTELCDRIGHHVFATPLKSSDKLMAAKYRNAEYGKKRPSIAEALGQEVTLEVKAARKVVRKWEKRELKKHEHSPKTTIALDSFGGS